MAIEQAFHDYLSSITDLTDIATGGVWCHFIDQSITTPAVYWDLTGCDHDHNLDGAAGRGVAYFDVVCQSRVLTEASSMGEIVRQNLDGFRGTWGSYKIAGVFLDNDWLPCQPPDNGSDKNGYYSKSISLIVRYDETIPSFS